MSLPGDSQQHLVMFVDDEEKTCKYFARIFEGDFRVVTAISAEEAWEVARDLHEEIAVVISDQRMPGEQGTTLLGRFEQGYPQIIRILTTAYSDLSSAIDSVNVGKVYEYISKPWEIDDLRAAIRRAIEVFQLRKDRQRLLAEKLSVVERMICLDRIRSLSVLATSLGGSIRQGKAALTSYVRQAPLKQRIELELENAANMDLAELVKLESVNMLHAIQEIRGQLFAQRIEEETEIELNSFLGNLLEIIGQEKGNDGLKIIAELSDSQLKIRSVPWMVEALFKLLINRMGDMTGEDMEIRAKLSSANGNPRIDLSVNTAPWINGQITALFSALMPIQKWPLGQDMDLLAAFFFAHHLGGDLTIEPEKPGFSVVLAQNCHASDPDEDPQWFGDLLKCLDMWKHEDEFAIEP